MLAFRYVFNITLLRFIYIFSAVLMKVAIFINNENMAECYGSKIVTEDIYNFKKY